MVSTSRLPVTTIETCTCRVNASACPVFARLRPRVNARFFSNPAQILKFRLGGVGDYALSPSGELYQFVFSHEITRLCDGLQIRWDL
jgi:hypothetical protein